MENIENIPTVDTGNPTPQEAGKTFTQEQVNAFVQDRLTRERAKYQADVAELETRTMLAERRLAAHRYGLREEIVDKYLKLAELYPNDENDFEKSLQAAVDDFPIPPDKAFPRIVIPAGKGHNSGGDPIREGMGLNRKE